MSGEHHYAPFFAELKVPELTIYAFTIILMVQLAEALRHNTGGSGFDSGSFLENFSSELFLASAFRRPWGFT